MQPRFLIPWLIGFLVTLAIGIGFWRSPSAEIEPPSSRSQTLTQSSQPLDVENLTLDIDRIFQDLEALAFERASKEERSRAQQYLTEQLEAAGWEVERQSFTSPQAVSESQNGVNLVAVRPFEEDSNSALIVAAHYDTVADSPGADDNGSSVATLLELARLFGDRPTPNALKLVFFDQEENGLWGSEAFVEKLTNERSPLDSPLIGAVILEMLGYACDIPGCQTYPEILPIEPPTDIGNFLAVVGNVEHPELVQAFQPQPSQQNASENLSDPFFLLPLQVPSLSPGSPDLMRSDHVPFWQNGYGAVMVTDTANFRNPHYHLPSDRPETLDTDFLTYSATTVVRSVARLLNADYSPR